MYQTVSKQDFIREFREYGEDNFSHAGLAALFDWLEDLADDTGQQMELDVIALCCEFSEYPSALDAVKDYLGQEAFGDADIQSEDEALDWLADRTPIIYVSYGSVIVLKF